MEQRRSNARADAGSPDNSYLQGMNLAYVVGNPVEDENALATLGISRTTPVNRLSVDETHTAQAELPGSSESAGSDQARPTSPHVVGGTVSQSARIGCEGVNFCLCLADLGDEYEPEEQPFCHIPSWK
ncbi:hypothetical protein FOZ61_001662 [Perkinsus olseni]|uniref:Uncharacterized protein n=1 Tax=Perkinsus olseni TaxID=32597 RepID=A0A7J6KSL8_PEROL|nr:hypothetical protein FOZ61_001662 [Perkinsus olseni]KAF4649854.1 hypothetical protein FOL46_001389 [Perkinsus olseni]